jgi:hypothetical protein
MLVNNIIADPDFVPAQSAFVASTAVAIVIEKYQILMAPAANAFVVQSRLDNGSDDSANNTGGQHSSEYYQKFNWGGHLVSSFRSDGH